MSNRKKLLALIALLAVGANFGAPVLGAQVAAPSLSACLPNSTRCSSPYECGQSTSCTCFPNPVLGPHCYDVQEN